jgi:SAM-dependent methyltransferase
MMTTAETDTFNQIAAEYHAMRPTYPDELFADLASAVGGAGQRVLEVGCGTGQATQGFLERQWEVVALDPGADLIALAKTQSKGPVEFHVTRFEDFVPEPAAFRLVASAQAWHWVDPDIGFRKVKEALQPRGVFAIFGHVPLPPAPEVLSKLEPIYAEIAPELWAAPPESWYLPQGPVRAHFDASGLFSPVTHKGYTWSQLGSAQTFVRQLRTRSYYNAIDPARRDRLLAEVEKALIPFGELLLGNETHLYWAALRS